MGVKKLGFILSLIKINLSDSLAKKGNFLTQLIFMTLNNLVFFTVWLIFFKNYEDINGWKLPEVKLMYGFAAGGFGVMMIFCGGLVELSKKIVGGELDRYLVLPKSAFSQVCFSGSRASGWGDVLACLILFIWSGYTSPSNIIFFTLLFFSVSIMYIAMGVVIQSSAFWLGPVHYFTRQVFEFLVTFSVYPQHIFPFGFRIVLFTLLPAGFISFLPVEIVKSSNIFWLIALVAISIFYLLGARLLFYKGLRRYESGNLVGS